MLNNQTPSLGNQTKYTFHKIKGASPRSFGTNVPSSERTKWQFQKPVATDVNLYLINVNNEAAID